MSARYYDEGEPAAGRKVLLAVPTYACPDTSLTFALARSREAMHAAGIPTALLILEGNCHVDDARNAIVKDFTESDCTELLFLDADVTWSPDDMVRLCKREQDVVGGVYPYRREGVETLPVRLSANREVVDGLREVDGIATGFLKIHRRVFEAMEPTRPWYKSKNGTVTLFFDRPTPDADHMRWGGDIDFCNRWRALGGKIYADEELRLGHVAKVILYDSLAAHLRRNEGSTLSHIMPRIKAGEETQADFDELYKFADNTFSGDPSLMATCAILARKCAGPVIETGSGLSSLVLAAAGNQPVYSLEHDQNYATQTFNWGRQAGVDPHICYAPLADDLWYDLDKFDLPERFALGICDGPPRIYGSRMQFFERLGGRCSMIVVDDMNSDVAFTEAVRDWAERHGRRMELFGRVAVLHQPETARKAA